MWDDAHLNVLVVPPNHGQLFNEESGILNGSDPNELTPNNSYLAAIEDGIKAWGDAINKMGADWLKEAYRADVYVLGRDTVPPDVLAAPEILVYTDESRGLVLGDAVRTAACTVRMSKIEILSFSVNDMFNVTAQEFGHCLGLSHIGSQGGADPTSEMKHPEHDVMNGFYTHLVGKKGTHRHCISNLDLLALEYIFGLQNPGLLLVSGGNATIYLSFADYGTTCEPPPADWRSRIPPYISGPLMQSRITSPTHNSTIKTKHFKEISGVVKSTSARAPRAEVAIYRKVAGGCEWWLHEEARFVTRDCASPTWQEAGGNESWRFLVATSPPPGTYEIISRGVDDYALEFCCEQGRNHITLTIVPSKRG